MTGKGAATARAGATTIADRYRLLRRLGGGGMGDVWEADDLVLERRVAVKLIHRAHQEDEDTRARFQHESRTAARLAHPNLATVYDYGESDDGVFLVMELVEGETLAARLRRGPLPPEQAAAVVADAADALATAHASGIIHRDVKPANLMLSPNGTKVVDFGIASGLGDPITATGLVIGTAGYLAPERVRGQGAGPEADVYALGAVLHEAITGEAAFPGDTPAEVALTHLQREVPDLGDVAPSVPPDLAAVCRAALAKDPAARPSATDLAARLRRIADSPSDASAGPPTTTMPAPVRPRSPRIVAAGTPRRWPSGCWWSWPCWRWVGGRSPGTTNPTATGRSAAAPSATTAAPTTTAPPTTAAPPASSSASEDLGEAAVNYIETLGSGDLEAAWALTSPSFQASQDRAGWESFWSGFGSLGVAGAPQVDEATGTVILPVDFGGRQESYQLQLVQGDDGRWLVNGPVGN